MRLVSEGEIERGMRGQPEFRRALRRVADAVSSEAVRIAREEGAGTAYTRKVGPAEEADGVVARASAADAEAEETGTGIYGPHRTIIRPKHGKVLVFKATSSLARRANGRRGSPRGGLVFAAYVRGTPARHIMERAAKAVAARSPNLTFRRGRSAPR